MTIAVVKILHVTFTMGIGGTEQVIRQIIENSDKEKFTHEILCIDGSIGPIGQELKEKGIHIECAQRRSGTDYKLILYIRRLLEQRSINVLHCHQYTPYFYGILSALWTKTRVIYTEHGRFYPDRHNIKRRLINPLLAFGTDKVTAISKSTADAVATYEYIPRNKIQIIYNGIQEVDVGIKTRDVLLRELSLSPDYRYIGTISRLVTIKNQSMMINAYFNAKKHIPKLRLIIIGDGEKMKELQRLAKSLNIENDVIFTGFINNPQCYISLFEIFLLSSFSEGTSMTLLESMSLGKPCVVTDVGGNPEIIINEVTGKVVQNNNCDLFSQAIVDLMNNKEKIKQYGNDARDRYKSKFSAEIMISEYERLYD
jgi:glycosyltransferase involved in cell wall biosynthesis